MANATMFDCCVEDQLLGKSLLYAKAVATVLQEEFGVPFTVFDGDEGTSLWPQDAGRGANVCPLADPQELRQIVGAARAELAPRPHGVYRLRLPVIRSGGPVVVAEATVRALAAAGPDAVEEQTRLARWAQTVLERLRQTDQLRSQRFAEEDLKSQLKTAWQLNLTLERLVRRLRIHSDSYAGGLQVLEAAFPFLNAEAVIWVPHTLAPASVQGEAVLAADDARSLIHVLRKEKELRDSGLLICNQVSAVPWRARFPTVDSLMVLAVPATAPVGWVLALNKRAEEGGESTDGRGETGFRRADAAALAPFAALLGLQTRVDKRYRDLKDLLVSLTRSLASAVDAKDPYTYGHSERVARISVEVGRELGLKEDELSDLYLAGLLHDVGKIGIRDGVLGKRGSLDAEETVHMREHPVIGHAIIKDLRQLDNVLPGVLHHHERYDGKGYPSGLAGEQIPLLARILAVADAYDAMSTNRPYRNALPPERVRQIFVEGADKQWEGRVVEALLRCRDRVQLIHERGLGESLRQALDCALRTESSSLVH